MVLSLLLLEPECYFNFQVVVGWLLQSLLIILVQFHNSSIKLYKSSKIMFDWNINLFCFMLSEKMHELDCLTVGLIKF